MLIDNIIEIFDEKLGRISIFSPATVLGRSIRTYREWGETKIHPLDKLMKKNRTLGGVGGDIGSEAPGSSRCADDFGRVIIGEPTRLAGAPGGHAMARRKIGTSAVDALIAHRRGRRKQKSDPLAPDI